MKKTFKFFAAALAIVAAASCAKEISNDNIQNENPTEDAVDKVFMTFDASIDTEETPDTKTTLNGKLVEWNEGDKITLYGTKSYNNGDGYNKHKGYCVIDPSTISEDKLRASFAGNVAASADYCAFYPGDNWAADEMTDYKYEFSGFAHQNAVKGSFDSSKHVMVARKLEDGCFNFKNVCALAKVTIGSEGVYSVKIDGIARYSGTDYGSIGGPYGWKTSGSLFEYAAISTNKVHYITLSNENGSELEVGATYYIVLPVCEIKGFTVSICNQSGAVLKSISKSSNFNVERNKIYDLGTFEVPDMVPAKVGDYFYSDGSYSTELDKSRTVVGVVFYAGNPTEDDTTLKKDFPNCVNGLVVGLTPTSRQSIGSKADGSWDGADFMTTVGADFVSWNVVLLEPGYSMTGYNNTQAIRYADPSAPSISICEGMQTVPNASKWFVPSVAEFGVINSVRDIVNASINNVRGEGLYGDYLTTTELKSFGGTYLVVYNVNDKSLRDAAKNDKDSGAKIRVIFAF